MENTKTFDFGQITFYESYLIVVINEGVIIDDDLNFEITQLIIDYYKERPFIYITNRVNSYSINPRVYEYTSLIDSLKAFVIVSNNETHTENVEVEKIFLKKPIKIFSNIETAVEWTTKTMEQHVKNA